MDHFWSALSKDVGRIPEVIKHVLEVTEYISAALAFVGNEEIAAIEKDIRELPEIMNKPANDPSLRKYFGRFAHSPERFRLMAGERAILKMIAGCIQRRGIQHYLRTAERREKEVAQAPAYASQDKQAHAQEVRRKIVDFCNDRCDGSAEQVEFCNRISNLNIEVSEAEDGSGGLVARIRCMFCTNDNDILCRPERVGSSNWKVSNFLAHIRNVHKNLNMPSSTGRAAAVGTGRFCKSPGNDLSAGESGGSNGYGAYEYWTGSSNDVSSSHENPFRQQRPAQTGGPSGEEFNFVVKEERYLPE